MRLSKLTFEIDVTWVGIKFDDIKTVLFIAYTVRAEENNLWRFVNELISKMSSVHCQLWMGNVWKKKLRQKHHD